MQLGPGNLVLAASNSFNGGTTITNGNLQVNNVGGLGSGSVTDNSSLVFSLTSAATYGGVIKGSGLGSLSLAANSNLTLTGSNPFAGTVTIATGGTLQVGDGAPIGNNSGVSDLGSLVFNHSDSAYVPSRD